jgi:hypothetical protein
MHAEHLPMIAMHWRPASLGTTLELCWNDSPLSE